MTSPTTHADRRVQGSFFLAAGITALFLFMGSAQVLMGVGLIEPGETQSLVARIVLLGFGGLLTFIGAGLGWRLAVALAGVPDLLGVLITALPGLVRRVDRHSLLAAAFFAPLVWGYWHPAAPDAWWRPSAATLIALVAIEFLLIHGFPFLVLFGSLAREGGGKLRYLVWAVFALLGVLYAAFAWTFGDGPAGVLTLLWLLAPNVLPFLGRGDSWTHRIGAIARWAIRFFTFVLAAIILDERTLRGAENLRLGAVYFTLIFCFEVFRIFELPLDLAVAWSRLPSARRQKAILTAS